MKNKLYIISVFILIIFTPILAEVPTYNYTLNGISYVPSSPIISRKDQLYISLNDVSNIFFGTITSNDSSYTLTTSSGTLKINTNPSKITFNQKKLPIIASSFKKNEFLFIPIESLTYMGCTYSIDTSTNTINFISPIPFSRNIDNFKNHTFENIGINLENPPKHLETFLSEDTFHSEISSTILKNSYISFLDNSAFSNFLNHLSSKMKKSPYNNLFVSFRMLDCNDETTKIISSNTYPLSISTKNNLLSMTFGETTLTTDSLWSTFYPKFSSSKIDLTKSIDMTIMRNLYEFYRNACDLRDDLYFSPILTLSPERTNTMSHKVYSVSPLGEISDYIVNIYRIHPSGSIHYIVDIEKNLNSIQ
ncbi:MAG: hypothetical protein ACRCSG_09245 [Cellulosilyticaceae bacterium]